MIGIDIGGTKIGIGVVIDKSIVYKSVIPTRSCIFEDIKKVVDDIYNMYTIDTVHICMPGKIKDGYILPNTAPQLDIYDINIYDKFEDILGKKVTVINDAIAQMLYGIHEAKIDNQKVGYLGPGTGLGGGFCLVKSGSVYLHTDGHIGDMIIDGKHVEKEMLSGMYIKEKLNISGKELSKKVNMHMDTIKEIGRNLAMVIEHLYTGKIHKARKETQWSEEDIAFVKDIDTFIIGGSLCTKGEMGKIILAEARYINKQKIVPIKIDTTDAGIIGATLVSMFNMDP